MSQQTRAPMILIKTPRRYEANEPLSPFERLKKLIMFLLGSCTLGTSRTDVQHQVSERIGMLPMLITRMLPMPLPMHGLFQ